MPSKQKSVTPAQRCATPTTPPPVETKIIEMGSLIDDSALYENLAVTTARSNFYSRNGATPRTAKSCRTALPPSCSSSFTPNQRVTVLSLTATTPLDVHTAQMNSYDALVATTPAYALQATTPACATPTTPMQKSSYSSMQKTQPLMSSSEGGMEGDARSTSDLTKATSHTNTAPKTAIGSAPTPSTNASSLRGRTPWLTPSNPTTSDVVHSSLVTFRTMEMMPASLHLNPYDGQLQLSDEIYEMIKNDFVNRKKKQDGQLSEDDEAVISIMDSRFSSMEKDPIKASWSLERLIGHHYVSIAQAQRALEKVVAMGVITKEELAFSNDLELILEAKENDLISMTSLGTLIRKILKRRTTSEA